MSRATVVDYSARYGEPTDAKRIEALLADAEVRLISEFECVYGKAYEEGISNQFDRALVQACCEMVKNALAGSPEFAGATQYSQSAGSYSASVTFGAPVGNLYISKATRSLLGLDVQVHRTWHPKERGAM